MESTITNRQLLRWSFGFLGPVKPLVGLACLYLTLWTAAEIGSVRITAEAINRIKLLPPGSGTAAASPLAWILGNDPGAIGLRTVIALLAGLTLSHSVFSYLREVTNTKLSMHMVFHIREAVYDRLQRAGFGFHDAISTGELINRSLTDLQNVRVFINSAVLISLEILLIVGGYIVVLLSRSPWVALLSLAPLPIWTWYVLRFSRRVQPTLKSVMESGDKDVSLIAENIAGVHVVKAFTAQSQEIGKYRKNCDEFYQRVMHRIGLFANFTPVMRSIATASHLSLFFAAGVLIMRHQLLAGDVLMLGAAMGAILGRLQQVTVINEQYQNAIVSARRLHEVLTAPPSVADRPQAAPLSKGPGAVRFENVRFGYDPNRPVLHDLSFEIPGGSIVAVVGPTGAGKTTLVSLIGRFYDPQQGRILIDGVDVRDVTLESLRAEVAYVFQETYLFSDTVQANIAYGKPGVPAGFSEAAARLAQAHDFVQDLPQGYATILGERGTTLSGGQRQRLAIARAILSDPRILVLDDATAAVDPETERSIRKAMRLVMADRTTFIIAHRISSVKHADLVIVLEGGRITQIGKHDELLRREGHYRQIVNLQLYGDAIDPDAPQPSHLDRMESLSRRRTPRPIQEEVADDPTS